ncbi:MAG: VWA domain-containing protein [Luteitalea sp.]
MLPRVLVVVAVALAGAVVAGQAPTDRTSPTFRVTAELIQFDARFLDADGRPVTDIRKDEVRVTQQGTVVPLSDLRFQPRGAPADVPGTAAPGTPQSAASPRAAAQASPDADPEPWVFLIDDMAMSPDAFARARTGLLAMLERGIPAGVEIGLLRTGPLGRHTTQLSSDREALRRAVTAMRYVNHGWRGRLTSRSGATGAGTASKDQIFLEGTLGSLNSLLVDLRQLPGRKVVVVLSEFIALKGNDADVQSGGRFATLSTQEYANVAGRLRRLGRLAAESGATVHTVDLAGVNNVGSKDRAELDEGLHAVADELGGMYFGRSNDVAPLLARLVASEQGLYVLSYIPPEGTFDRRATPRFIPLTVTVSRPGVTVRTRSGFFTR